MKYLSNLSKDVNYDLISEMSKLFNLDYNLVHLLYSRGINTKEKLKKYLNPSIIDLNDPFPERNPGANWVGKESIITSTKDKLSTLQRFVISLERSSINKVREYNDVHSYDTFDLNDKEKSSFIIANENIVDRK